MSPTAPNERLSLKEQVENLSRKQQDPGTY